MSDAKPDQNRAEVADTDIARLEGDQGQHRQGSFLMLLRESVIVIGMALLLSLIVKTWLMQAFYIPSESMENTLLKGDRVIVSKRPLRPSLSSAGTSSCSRTPVAGSPDQVAGLQGSPRRAALQSTA